MELHSLSPAGQRRHVVLHFRQMQLVVCYFSELWVKEKVILTPLTIISNLLCLQVLHSLFGSRLASLILAPPPSDDITEGSSGHPHRSSSSSSPSRGLAGRQEAVPRFFLDFLQQQSKMRRRGRTSMVGGRGCFGMKMDRIGSISRLGC